MNQNLNKTEDSAQKSFGEKCKDAWNYLITKKQTTSDYAKEAEKHGFTISDLTVAMFYDPYNPIQWLVSDFESVVGSVVYFATTQGYELPVNDVGILTIKEAKNALYLHKGIDAAVKECISQRQEGVRKLRGSGDFMADDIIDALYYSEGDVTKAYEYLLNSGSGVEPGIFFDDEEDAEEQDTPQASLMTVDNGDTCLDDASDQQQQDDQILSGSSKQHGTEIQAKEDVNKEQLPEENKSANKSQLAEKVLSFFSFIKVKLTPTSSIFAHNADPTNTEDKLDSIPAGDNDAAQKRRVRRFIAEGIFNKPEMAEVASQLITYGFDERDAIAAAMECSSVDMALTYLQIQECPICATDCNIGKMITMLNCEHSVCPDCTKAYFSGIIKERNIMEAMCPCCKKPGPNDDDVPHEYFTNLQIMLKNLVDRDVYDLFDRKLRDRALMSDPNFRWCQKCGSGFIAVPNQTKAVCPDCRTTYCVKCNRQWENQHENLSCDKYAQWKLENDIKYQSAGLEKYLAVYGIDCPKCKFKYELAKGGCMHFICSQCKHQFCSGCGGTYQQTKKCRISPTCHLHGLHAHHPRSCLFYLRDWEHEQLLKLLSDNNVRYDIGVKSGDVKLSKKCPVLEQKETPGNTMMDAVCGKEVKEKCSGLCELHFVEYLVSLINKHGLDPVNLMSVTQMQQELRRNEKKFPAGENTEKYRKTLKQDTNFEYTLH